MTDFINNKNIGNKGENIAVEFLKKKNHVIIERNFHSNFGEIDIITFFNNSLYIYEVKFRRNTEYGFGDDSITKSKIQKIKKTFDVWLSKNSENYNFENIYMNALIIDPDETVNEFEIM